MIEHIGSWWEVVRVTEVKRGTRGFPVEESKTKWNLGTLFSEGPTKSFLLSL